MNPGWEASALGAVIVVAASTVAAASLTFRASLLTRQQEHCRLDALLDQPRRRTPPGGDSAVLLPIAVPARLVPPAIGPMCSGRSTPPGGRSEGGSVDTRTDAGAVSGTHVVRTLRRLRR